MESTTSLETNHLLKEQSEAYQVEGSKKSLKLPTVHPDYVTVVATCSSCDKEAV